MVPNEEESGKMKTDNYCLWNALNEWDENKIYHLYQNTLKMIELATTSAGKQI